MAVLFHASYSLVLSKALINIAALLVIGAAAPNTAVFQATAGNETSLELVSRELRSCIELAHHYSLHS